MSPKPPFPPKQNKPNKQRLMIGVLLAVVLLGGIVSFLLSGGKSAKTVAKKNDIVTITLPPPPPPPPPPPKVEPPKPEPPPEDEKEELVEEPPLEEPPPEAPSEEPPAEVLGTNIQGGGPGMAGLGTSGNGGGNRNSIGGGSKQARIDWYAKKILVSTIKETLQRNPSTKSVVMDDGIRVWIDKDGRVVRIKLLGSTNNLAALEQVLVGLQTSQAPPAGMPPYIDFKIKARKAGV